MDTHTRISITTDTFLRALVIGAVAVAIWKLHTLVLLVLTAIVIASAIEPGVAFFAKRKIPRVLAVLGMYVLVFGSLFATIYVFLPPFLDDMQGLIATVPQYINTLNLPASITSFGGGSSAAEGSLVSSFFEFRSAFSETGEGAFRLLSAVFGGIFALGIVVVLSFYFAIQETGIDDFLKIITPAKNEAYVVGLWLRAKNKIGLWMQGQLLSSLIGGVISYLGLLILGVPYALIISIFTAAAMLVPIFGSFIAALPAVLVAFSTGGVALAGIVAGLYFIINQFEAHLINPLIVNKIVGIPPLLVILALIVGGELAGFLGVVLAIPVAAGLREFLNDFDHSKRKARELIS
jgi:predicted PurR-regulated permease PerM|tara:strand:+ start:530760 stop:531806 length:1047 start_codon:yes stop_codon:yes gene_type:complete